MRQPKVDDGPAVRVARLAGQAEGIVTAAELYVCGLTRGEVRTRLRQRTLHRVHRGVYAVGHGNLSPSARCVAAVKACGDGAILGLSSAAATMGLFSWEEGLPPEVLVVGSGCPRRAGIRVRRSTAMPPQDVRELGAIRVTSPARTVADLAARLDDEAVLRLVRLAQGKQLVNHRQLLAVSERLGCRPGSGRLARAIARGPAPTRSVLEDVVLDLILSAGFAQPDVNVPIRLGGRLVVPDFRWAEQRLTVEADGANWHSGAAAAASDAERQALLEAHGERVERISWQQAISAAKQTRARLERAGAPKAP